MRKFKHYKGNIYKLLLEATHSETGEKMMVYMDESENVYARPSAIFFEEIELNGKKIPRFKEIKD